jgi:hypothetical protein
MSNIHPGYLHEHSPDNYRCDYLGKAADEDIASAFENPGNRKFKSYCKEQKYYTQFGKETYRLFIGDKT